MRRPLAHVNMEQLLGLLGGLLMLSTIAIALSRIQTPSSMSPNLPIIAAFFIAIAGGELFRISLPDSRETAPMASAASLGFAMTVEAPTGTPAGYPAVTVIAVSAVAIAVGLVPQVARRRAVQMSEVANRLISVAVASVLFRELPVSGGRTVLELQAGWRPYVLAMVMVLVSAIALTVQVLLLAGVRAAGSHAPFRRVLLDEVRAAFGLTAALSTTGPLIALAERPLGVVAIPLFLLPLLLTQFAVRRHSAIRLTYRQTIRSLSRLTELGGYTQPGHAGRVATMATAVGRDLGMSEREVLDLEYAALLHDLGQVSLIEPIPGGATLLAAPRDQQRIARDGADIVRETGVLENVAVIMEAQTTPYRQVREFGEDLPLSSRIIKVVNAYDDLVGDSREAARKGTAIERIHLGLGYEYDPRVVDSLSRVLARRAA